MNYVEKMQKQIFDLYLCGDGKELSPTSVLIKGQVYVINEGTNQLTEIVSKDLMK